MKAIHQKNALNFAKGKLVAGKIRYSGELQVGLRNKVDRVFRPFSEVLVEGEKVPPLLVRLDERTGDVVGWRYPANFSAGKKIAITEEKALALAKKELAVPKDAECEGVRFHDHGDGGKVAEVRWQRFAGGIPVLDDYIRVKIQAETNKVISVAYFWGCKFRVPKKPKFDTDPTRIRTMAEKAIRKHTVLTPSAQIESIRLVYAYPQMSKSPKNAQPQLAYLVRFIDHARRPGAWTEIAISTDGKTLKINWSL